MSSYIVFLTSSRTHGGEKDLYWYPKYPEMKQLVAAGLVYVEKHLTFIYQRVVNIIPEEKFLNVVVNHAMGAETYLVKIYYEVQAVNQIASPSLEPFLTNSEERIRQIAKKWNIKS